MAREPLAFADRARAVVYLTQQRHGSVDRAAKDTGELEQARASLAHVDFSPDGRLLAVAAVDVVQLWDVARREKRAELRGHAGVVNAVRFAPDGQRLATASCDATARLWDVRTGQEVASFAHTGPVGSLHRDHRQRDVRSGMVGVFGDSGREGGRGAVLDSE